MPSPSLSLSVFPLPSSGGFYDCIFVFVVAATATTTVVVVLIWLPKVVYQNTEKRERNETVKQGKGKKIW